MEQLALPPDDGIQHDRGADACQRIDDVEQRTGGHPNVLARTQDVLGVVDDGQQEVGRGTGTSRSPTGSSAPTSARYLAVRSCRLSALIVALHHAAWRMVRSRQAVIAVPERVDDHQVEVRHRRLHGGLLIAVTRQVGDQLVHETGVTAGPAPVRTIGSETQTACDVPTSRVTRHTRSASHVAQE